MKVLTVDDDESALEMLGLILSEAGYTVLTARNGKEALEKIQAEQVRLLITDWEMPEMDGLELCRAVRGASAGGYVYIIILTCHDGCDRTVEGLSAGADEFVSKPFDPAELLLRVQTGERILGLETRDLVIFTVAKLAESRDPETGAHLERVRNHCRAVAEWLSQNGQGEYRINKSFVETVYLTSPLHDIGKVGIPDSILLKPSRLSDREFEIMKTHTVVGAEALGAAVDQFPDAGFLRMARDIARSHHERHDGTGYPDGLVGANIPLSARIVALADVYDALTSRRPYKNAYATDVSRCIIVEESGSHFAPEIVQAFLAVEPAFVQVHQRYSDAVPSAA